MLFLPVWWCIRYFTIFGLTGLVLWGRFSRALERPSPVVGQGWFLFVPSLPLGLQPYASVDPWELAQGGCVLPSPSPSSPCHAGFDSGAEPQASCLGAPEHRASGCQRRVGAGGRALAPREGPALGREAGCVTPMVSVALLLKAEVLPCEKSLWSGDCSVFSDFFSNPLDQREKNQAWLVIPALSLLQHPESWSEGSPCAGAVRNDGCDAATTASQLLPPPTASGSSGLQ